MIEMGPYERHILPRLIDLVMRNKEATRLRASLVPKARGDVLEVGIGSGLNLPFYGAQVNRVFGVDPSLALRRMVPHAANNNASLEIFTQPAEQELPLPDASIDTAVMTWTLCSIPQPAQALRQIRRVLKQDGQFLFIEHGRSHDRNVEAWQDRLTPIWKRIAGGCHLNRKVDDLIATAGFRMTELNTFYIVGPRFVTYTYQGVAQPA